MNGARVPGRAGRKEEKHLQTPAPLGKDGLGGRLWLPGGEAATTVLEGGRPRGACRGLRGKLGPALCRGQT